MTWIFGSPCWVSAEKTIDDCFLKRCHPKCERAEPSRRRRSHATHDGDWREPATVCAANDRWRDARRVSQKKKSKSLGSCPKGQFCKNTVYLERGMPYSCFCLSAFGTLDFSHHFNKFLFTGDINKPYRGKVNIKTYLLSSVDLFAIMHFDTPNEPIDNGGC